MPYRPSRKRPDHQTGSPSLFFRFLKRYLVPHRKMIALSILLVSMNTCSIYLQAYYGRIVVDHILVIAPESKPGESVSGLKTSILAGNRTRVSQRLPERGGLSNKEQAANSSRRPPGAMGKLMSIFVVYLLTVFILNLARRLAGRVNNHLSRHITSRIREDIHHKILSLSSSYHKSYPPGRLMARILSDVNVVQKQMVITILTVSSYVVMFLVGSVLVIVLEWRVALFVLCAIIPYTFTIRKIRPKIQRVNQEAAHTNACLWGLVSQKLDSIRAILAYGRERYEQLNFHRLSSCFLRDILHQERLGAVLNRSAQIITSMTTVGIFIYCTNRVLDNSMTLGTMMYIYGASASLFAPVYGLTQMSLKVTKLLVVMRRLAQVMDEPLEIKEAPSAVDFPAHLNSGISMHKLTFSYSSEREPVLRNVNLTIPAGQWVCIMGSSGSGKSTLLHLISRLYDPCSGQILIDGIPVSGIKFASLRRHMALVPQEAQILSGTVRDNITYGYPDAKPSEIIAAAQASDSHDFIMELPVKYETIIGEKGVTLSGGQRQRISIARALLTKPEVLLLDDFTSALDAHTERRVQDTITRLMPGKTAVVVSQRVSMAMRCHKICVLDNGVISETGTHEKLIAKGGFYARLHAQQTE